MKLSICYTCEFFNKAEGAERVLTDRELKMLKEG